MSHPTSPPGRGDSPKPLPAGTGSCSIWGWTSGPTPWYVTCRNTNTESWLLQSVHRQVPSASICSAGWVRASAELTESQDWPGTALHCSGPGYWVFSFYAIGEKNLLYAFKRSYKNLLYSFCFLCYLAKCKTVFLYLYHSQSYKNAYKYLNIEQVFITLHWHYGWTNYSVLLYED